LSLAYENSKNTTRLAFLNADWRNYQSIPTYEENENESILMPDYFDIRRDTLANAQYNDTFYVFVFQSSSVIARDF